MDGSRNRLDRRDPAKTINGTTTKPELNHPATENKRSCRTTSFETAASRLKIASTINAQRPSCSNAVLWRPRKTAQHNPSRANPIPPAVEPRRRPPARPVETTIHHPYASASHPFPIA
jgi:hypothetical protein